jgi:uncharacterized surface protein with fasciclin (FAS1) repeats
VTTPTIAGTLALSGTGFDANRQDFDILKAAVAAAGLTATLDDPGATFTVFAPTDQAFLRLAQSLGYSGRSEQAALDTIVDTLTALAPDGNPIPLLTSVLTYHVVQGELIAGQVLGSTSITTLNGAAITPFGFRLGDLDPTAADPLLVTRGADIDASNGIIQTIDRVLLPTNLPEAVPSQPAQPTLAALLDATGNGFDTNAGDFDILEAAVGAAGLTGALANAAARLTVLAPTDAGFIRLAENFGFNGTSEQGAFDAIVAGLTAAAPDGNPIPLLTEILQYHILDGTFSLRQLRSAGEAQTLLGDPLDIRGLRVIDADPGNAARFVVDGTNIQASNGALQTIDNVLLPFNLPGTIADELANSGTGFDANATDFDILNAALSAAGLTAVLDDAAADYTLFAPTDAAFLSLARDLGFTGTGEQAAFTAISDALAGLAPGGNPIPLLTDILTYHVAAGALTRAEIAAERSITTLEGTAIEPFGFRLRDGDPGAPDAVILPVLADAEATNGIIQAVNRVLLPFDVPGVGPATPARPTIADIIDGTGTGFDTNRQDFDILKAALGAAGLTGALDDTAADLTLLAPTDAAFVSLARSLGYAGRSEAGAFDAIVDALTGLSPSGDPIPLLTDILTYHVLDQGSTRQQLAGEGTAGTLFGPDLTFDGLRVIDAEPDTNARIIAGRADAEAANGTLIAINTVLLPLDLAPV